MRRGMTTTRALSAVGAAGGLLLVATVSGCTGEPQSAPTQTWTPVYESPWPEPSPTPSPTPTDPAAIPPERPVAMDTVDAAGAEAFATYFIELFPYAHATGDVDAVREHSHADCIFCSDLIARTEAQAAAGGHTVGGLMDVQAVTALEVDPGKWWGVSMEVIEAPLADLDGAGEIASQSDEAAYHLDLAVVRENGTWLMREVSFEVKG